MMITLHYRFLIGVLRFLARHGNKAAIWILVHESV